MMAHIVTLRPAATVLVTHIRNESDGQIVSIASREADAMGARTDLEWRMSRDANDPTRAVVTGSH